MKKTFKKKIILLLSIDILLIPALFLCEWISEQMLALPGACIWTTFGGKCITCGGTHFVNSLLNGQLIQAYHYNELLFIFAVIFLISYILLHIWWIGKSILAKRILSIIYSIPGVIILCLSLFLFLIIRNIPVIKLIVNFIAHR